MNQPKPRILLVEDELHVAELIKKGLEEDCYEVELLASGSHVMQTLTSSVFQLVILDILLPGMNGLDVCKQIRKEGFATLPILMLTALGSAENVVLGLDSGADDYLAKPFKLIELKARIRTLLRRVDASLVVHTQPQHEFAFADVVLNDTSKTVVRNGIPVSLTSTEFRLLHAFLKNPHKVMSRTTLLDEVWGINFDMGTNVVDVYVNYLRKKLDVGGKGEMPKLIHTVIGMGYVLKDTE